MKSIDKNVLQDAVICKEEDSVLEVSRIMRDTRTRHIIVVDSELKPKGIISPFDVNNRVVAEGKDPSSVRAEEIMTSPVESVDVNSSYEEAAEKMIDRETFTLPVVDKGKLIGTLDYSSVFANVCEVKK